MSRESFVGFEAGNVNRDSWFEKTSQLLLPTATAIAIANCHYVFHESRISDHDSRISNFMNNPGERI